VTPTLPLSPNFSEEEPRLIRTQEPNNPSNMRPAPADTDISKTPQLQDYETLFGDCINYPSSSDESSDSFHGFGLLSEESGSTITLRREQYHRVLDSHRRMEVDNESFNIPAITTTGELAVTPPPSPPTSLEQAEIDNDLGDTFYDAGHFRDAIGAYESALAKRVGALGRQHASTLSILYSMGLSYFQLGDSEKAREHLLQVLEAQESILSKDHPATLLTLQDLGRMCYENGDYEAGQKWYERTLAVQKKVLGNDDLRTLDTVHLLGFICYQRKDYEQGRGYFSRALTGRAKLLGGGHSLTLTSVRSLGLALWQQHKYREALNWYEYALVEQRNQLKNSAATSKQLERSFMDTLFSTCLLCCQLGYRTKVREFLELSYFRGLGNVEAEVLAARKYDTGLYPKYPIMAQVLTLLH